MAPEVSVEGEVNHAVPAPIASPAGDRPRIRGPFSRWPRAADAVLAVAMFAATVLFADGPGDTIVIRSPGGVPVGVLLVFGLASAALVWRRRRPVVVLGVVVAAWAATLGSGYEDLGGVALVALYSTGRYAPAGPASYVAVGGAVVVGIVDGSLTSVPWGETAFTAVVLATAWYVGRRLQLRAARRAEQARERAAEARRIVTEERARIARELHDVVAHRVSLMTVQAGAARAIAAADPQAATQAMASVEEAGRQALDELRHLLGVLRPEAETDVPDEPQPGIADLPGLVQRIRGAGLDVAATVDGVPDQLPARVELSVYRIVQESLTNVLKHAGPDARVEVRVRGDGPDVVVEVVDDGAGVAGSGGTGHGIVGMRERALLLGGRLDTGPCAGGGFKVSARLPVRSPIGGEPA